MRNVLIATLYHSNYRLSATWVVPAAASVDLGLPRTGENATAPRDVIVIGVNEAVYAKVAHLNTVKVRDEVLHLHPIIQTYGETCKHQATEI